MLGHVIGMVDQGVGGAQERAEALRSLLGSVTSYAERVGTADALATLQVLAALDPEDSRADAALAAQRVAARGAVARPWAGRPRCDRHAGPGRGGVHREPDRDLRRHRPGERAAVMLREALAEDPCPVEDDQIEDIAVHRCLVHSRARRLAELAGLPAEPERREAATPLTDDVLQLKVSLRWAKPPIRRRLEVPASMTLQRLHEVLQVAFGWHDAHLHEFETEGSRHGRALKGAALRRTRVVDVVATPGEKALYRYDFGDNWEHVIEVEDRHAPVPGRAYPTCTAGRRAAPPEDCGGIPGYQELVDALANPADPEHADLLEWAPAGYDPARFDRTAIDTALTRLR